MTGKRERDDDNDSQQSLQESMKKIRINPMEIYFSTHISTKGSYDDNENLGKLVQERRREKEELQKSSIEQYYMEANQLLASLHRTRKS
jgi:hypothetical protein